MFDEFLPWLKAMTPAEKQELLDNITNFNRLKTWLCAKNYLKIDPKNRNFVVVDSCAQVEEFLALVAKMKNKSVVVRDERQK